MTSEDQPSYESTPAAPPSAAVAPDSLFPYGPPPSVPTGPPPSAPDGTPAPPPGPTAAPFPPPSPSGVAGPPPGGAPAPSTPDGAPPPTDPVRARASVRPPDGSQLPVDLAAASNGQAGPAAPGLFGGPGADDRTGPPESAFGATAGEGGFNAARDNGFTAPGAEPTVAGLGARADTGAGPASAPPPFLPPPPPPPPSDAGGTPPTSPSSSVASPPPPTEQPPAPGGEAPADVPPADPGPWSPPPSPSPYLPPPSAPPPLPTRTPGLAQPPPASRGPSLFEPPPRAEPAQVVPAPATVPVPEPATKPVPTAPTAPPPAAAPLAPEPVPSARAASTPPPGYRVAHTPPEQPARDGVVSASVKVPPANRLEPGVVEVPVFTPQPRVYGGVPAPAVQPVPAQAGPGQPAPAAVAPTAPGHPEATTPGGPAAEEPRGRPLPVYSDLLAPGTDQVQAASPPAEAASFGQPTATAPTAVSPNGAAVPHPRGAVAPADPFSPPAAAPQSPAGAPPSGPTGTGQTEDPPSEEFDPKGGPPVGVIVGAVIVGAAVLVLVALGMPFLMSKLRPPASGPTYAVGDCVIQDGDNAVIADCDHPDAYEIVSRVATATDCPDPTLPTVAAGEDVFCLERAGADDATDEGGDGGEEGGEAAEGETETPDTQ